MIHAPMSAVVAFIFVTLPWLNPFSPGPTASVGPLLFSWLCAALLLLALAFDRQRGQDQLMVRAVAQAWVLAALLNALIGLLQYFGAITTLGVWLNHTGAGEAFGNLRQRNQFATLLNIGLVALLWSAANPPDRLTRWSTALLVVLAALLGAANAASSSRTGLFQLVLVLGLTLWWHRRAALRRSAAAHDVLLVLASGLLSYAVAMFALPWLAGLDPFAVGAWARLRAGDSVCSSRLTLWGNVLHLIAQKPWLGWGWGELDYAHFITLYPGARFCDILDNAHNLPLHLAVELGVPAALLLCGTGLWLAWRAQPWRETDPTRQLAWGVLAVILLHSLLEYPLWYGPFQMAAGLSVWLLWRQSRLANEPQTFKPFRPVALYLYASTAIILIIYCSFAAWEYRRVSQIYLTDEERAPAYRDNTLEKIRDVWLYQDQLRFAELTTADLSPDNATALHKMALETLHFSPEARVIERLLDSAQLLGKRDEVAFYAARYQAAFPKDYAQWISKHTQATRLKAPNPTTM